MNNLKNHEYKNNINAGNANTGIGSDEEMMYKKLAKVVKPARS